MFVGPGLQNLGVKVWQLVGNHDVYYKNTNKINSIDGLLSSYDNIIPISKPGEYDINGFKAFMLPWICDENYQQTISTIAATNAKVAFGHLELQGFQLYPGCIQERGIDKGIIEKFETVFSGHYHTRSNDGQTFYLGNPYQMYWNDCGDKRGFNILDTDTGEIEFVEKDELLKMNVLRKILSSMGTMDAIEFLLSKLRNTKNNADFFISMNKPS